jgi:uncharacterized protein
VPALCVGGWRDAFPDGLVDAYERVAGPKKLLMGPWGHLLPHRSAYEPVDFLAIALRWWDHWLRGVPTGVMDEPPVTLYHPGPQPRWIGYETWPPAATDLSFATDGDTTLRPARRHPDRHGRVIAQHRPDATVGALRGLPGLGMGEDFAPRDQQDDDRRSVSLTSPPLAAPIVVGGRPEVSVRLDGAAGRVRRLVVRLTDVHPDGRSELITAGVLCPPPGDDRLLVRLRPIVAPVPAGHRLRVALGDADFPRLVPLAEPVPFAVRSVRLSVPALAEAAGSPVDVPALDLAPAVEPAGNDLRVTRDAASGEVEVVVTEQVNDVVSPGGHTYRLSSELRARVRPSAPGAAVAGGTQTGEVHLSTGEVVTASVAVRCTQASLWATAEVTTNGSVVLARSWETVLVPECPAVGGR